MKKNILTFIAAVAIGSFTLVSCSENSTESSHEAAAETHGDHDHDHDHADAYQCPMDCEDGKTYEEAGKCPVCEMDIVKIEHEH